MPLILVSQLDHCCMVLVDIPLYLTVHLDLLLISLGYNMTATIVWLRLLGIAPVDLQEVCRLVSTMVGHQALYSSSGGELLVPH